MPTYVMQCSIGHRFERFVPLSQFDTEIRCACGLLAERVITAPLLVASSPDVCYDSPVTGQPITSMAARREDLARTNCVPYEPGMKQDYARKQQESDAALEQAVSDTVREAVTKMPTHKRGQLHSELVRQGADLSLERKTVGG